MGLLPMDLDILPPSDGRVFKLILTAPDTKPVLMDFLSSIIQCPIANSQKLSTVQIAKADACNNEILSYHDTQEMVTT